MRAVGSVKAAVLVDAGQHLKQKLVSANHKQVRFSQEKGEPKLNGTEVRPVLLLTNLTPSGPSGTGTTRQSRSAPSG